TATARARTAVARCEEALTALDVELGTVAAKLARVVDAVETMGGSRTLKDRLTSLEAEHAKLVAQQRPARERLDAERDRLRNVKEETAASRNAFKDWQAGTSKNPDARQRLALALREMLSWVK